MIWLTVYLVGLVFFLVLVGYEGRHFPGVDREEILAAFLWPISVVVSLALSIGAFIGRRK